MKERADRLAIQALSFLADDPERLDRFLALSGLTPQSLRQAASEPGFLLAVLEHLSGEEALLLEFAAHQRCDPAAITRAREVLGHEEREMP